MEHLSLAELLVHAITRMANAVSERPGESQNQRFIRSQVATGTILGLAPRDMTEAMLAGHAVMFHEVMTDSIGHTLLDEPDAMLRGSRSNIVALNRAFHMNLDRLKQYQVPAVADVARSSRPRPDSGRPGVPVRFESDINSPGALVPTRSGDEALPQTSIPTFAPPTVAGQVRPRPSMEPAGIEPETEYRGKANEIVASREAALAAAGLPASGLAASGLAASGLAANIACQAAAGPPRQPQLNRAQRRHPR